MHAMMLTQWIVTSSLALGAPAATTLDPPVRAERTRPERKYDMEMSFRGRRMSIPRGVLDLWYIASNSPLWPLPGEERPHVQAWSYGMEFVVKAKKDNGIFWFDWIDLSMPDGYWQSNTDSLGGNYLQPTRNLGLVSFGADYAYEASLVRLEQTRGIFGLSLVVGGGLGLAVMVGDIQRWSTSPDGVPAYTRFEDGLPPDTDNEIPRLYPMVDIHLGLRLNFANRVVIRLEGGLHSMLFYGVTIGYRF
jgi:hypothetical protein